MRPLQLLLNFLGRLFISAIFILSAGHKIFHWQEASAGLVHMLSNWQVAFEGNVDLYNFFSACLYFSPVFLALAIALELVGGIFVLTGFKARLGAFFLILFLIPTTIIFHHFWYFDGIKRDIEFAMFLKNIAILGGLLYILIYGSSVKKCSQQPHKLAKPSDQDAPEDAP
ncbi:MAG: DoxX family protein [Chlamydiota bacterium]